MSIDDLPLHPGLQLAPAGCYLPLAIAVPDAATLEMVAARLAIQFPTPFPATAGEVEMVAAGLAMGCTSPRWRQGGFWQCPVPERAYDFRAMAEFMVTPDRFEWARGRGWSAEWPREIHFQMPEPEERMPLAQIVPPHIPRGPDEALPDWRPRVAAQRQTDNAATEAPHPLRNTKYDNAPHFDADEMAIPRFWNGSLRTDVRLFDVDAIEYDEVDGDFAVDMREDW